MVFGKELLTVEDMVLSMDATIDQTRGAMTPFNASHLPYSATENVKAALDARYTATYINANFAKLGGDSSNVFEVATATAGTHAITLTQYNSGISALETGKANKDNVLLKVDPDGTNDGYHPINDYSPCTKKYSDGLIADKFLGAITGKFVAMSTVDGSDVTVTVTNGVITGIV